MWEVCKIMSTLSHGQSSVEGGFTVNKQLSIENLKEKSLIALCRVADHMSASEETPKKFKSPEICCIMSKMPAGNTKKTFANNGRGKTIKESH